MTNREQISVPLPAELRDYVKRTAEREDRSAAGSDPVGVQHLQLLTETFR
jgi:hypothetical protein